MAAINLEPPGPFDIKQPEQWSRCWKRRFEQYHIASGLDSEDHATTTGVRLIVLHGPGRRICPDVDYNY